MPHCKKAIDCKTDTMGKTFRDTNMTRTDKAGSRLWTAVSLLLELIAVYCLYTHFLADQISCSSYVDSVYRMRSLAVYTYTLWGLWASCPGARYPLPRPTELVGDSVEAFCATWREVVRWRKIKMMLCVAVCSRLKTVNLMILLWFYM